MKAYLFPGQGAQFPGMGADLYRNSSLAKNLFDQANEVLGFSITEIMFNGSAEDLKQTQVTQPAIFLHSVVQHAVMDNSVPPNAVAGHSLGEFSALVVANVMSFEDGLRLVHQRALAMQDACEKVDSSMAAVLGLENEVIEKICSEISGIVVPANYNCPGQLVISGGKEALVIACEKMKEAGAKRALILPVGGAFHSPLMSPAKESLGKAIEKTTFSTPFCPVYQNVNAKPIIAPEEIKTNLIDQLTAPVLWSQSVQQMIADGMNEFVEIGPGKTLQGLVKKIDRQVATSSGEI